MLYLILTCLIGQQSFSSKAFEVASVKISTHIPVRAEGLPKARIDPARVEYSFVTIYTLLMKAYGVTAQQIIAPDWMSTAHYDVVATLPDGAVPDDIPMMLQTLLKQRFQLALHQETRQAPLWELVLDKGGPHLKSGDPDREGRFMVAPVGTDLRVVGDVSLSSLAERLGNLGHVVVVDRTGMPGVFRIDMNVGIGSAGIGVPGAAGAIEPSSGRGSVDILSQVSDAMRKSLGLRLELRKGPLQFIVVDRADKVPTPN
jgi:uncharacterized protein (TIGR03435 family)